MSRKKPPLSETDKALWGAYTAEVKPMRGGTRRRISEAAISADHKDVHRKVAKTIANIPLLYERAPRPHQQTELQIGRHENIDANNFHRFSTGRMNIAGRIDLHGMKQLEAESALARFIIFSAHQGRRCVLVITGKSGVLRQEAPRWLNDPKLRPHILAVHPAQAKDGGSGALYILLKRRREA